LQLWSGYGSSYFPVFAEQSAQIPHHIIASPSLDEELALNSSLLEQQLLTSMAELEARQEVEMIEMFEKLKELSFEARLLYDYAKSFLLVKIMEDESEEASAGLLLRFHDKIDQGQISMIL